MSLESRVDVLIIGAGPGGAMCANALAMAGVNVRIIDKRPIGVAAGQADGIAPRTMEVLQSYGLAERILREGSQSYLYAFYDPGPDGKPQCTKRMPFVTDPDVPFPFLIGLKQAAIEANFLDSLKAHGVEVERPKHPSRLEVSDDADELSNPLAYPVKVTVQRLDENDNANRPEIIHAKYVVGADGAHSWVRKTLGISMDGEQTDYVWGVMDMKTESDFPDIRKNASVHSTSGNCLIIPREDGKNRIYIQLADGVLPSTERFDKNSITPEILLSVAEKILHPYKLGDPKRIEWWSLYIIGQRIASSYSIKDRVFIVGDACHTHSPKGGQGMNAAINDSHNLAWKLLHVIRGWSSPSLLKTYEHERRRFAQDLLNSDKEYATLASRKPKTAEKQDGVASEQYVRALQKRHGLFSGFGLQYPVSAIVNPQHQESAEGLIIGRRMLPYIFIRAADVRPLQIHDLLPLRWSLQSAILCWELDFNKDTGIAVARRGTEQAIEFPPEI